MQKTKLIGKKRRYRPISSRRLTRNELLVLDFLWSWKVASSPMLGLVGYPNKSTWWVYKALRRLHKDKYIQRLPRGKNLDQELWALTELGFEVVLMDRDDINAYRYKPHAPTHDFLATCLQLGDFWKTPMDKQFFTEQMLASLAKTNFPTRFNKIKEHVPDGVTMVTGPLKKP